MRYLASLLVFAAVMFALTFARPASVSAQPMMMARPHLVSVNKCDPRLNGTWPGYAVAYYPASGPYWWNDPWGRRYLQPAYSAQGRLAIDYVNVSNKTMSRVEFGLLARGSLVAEVRDVGTFSPGAEIKHEFGISPNVFPLGTGLARCVPLRIRFADGTRWVNPHLPAISSTLYR